MHGTTKFGKVTPVGRGIFLRGQSEGGGPKCLRSFWDLLHPGTAWDTTTKFWWSNYMWGNYYRVEHVPCFGQFFWWHECWRAICLQ